MSKERKEKVQYLPDLVAFDIETSSYYFEGNKCAVVYAYALGVNDEEVQIFRERDDFIRAIKKLAKEKGASLDKRLLVYVHNLAYEWQFIRRYFTWVDAFAIGDIRKVARACTEEGIEFRCHYFLTNTNLAKVGKDVGIDKLVGDLDYELIRHSGTPLSDKEKEYIVHDIRIIIESLKAKTKGTTVGKIPLTKTGYVRRLMRKATKGLYYRNFIKNLVLDKEMYLDLRRAFMGGYTHANHKIAGQPIENVISYDIASSYPASIVANEFPMTTFYDATEEIQDLTTSEILEFISNYSALVSLTLLDLTAKNEFPALSESKVIDCKGVIADNGRILRADVVTTTVTDVDLSIILRSYELSNIDFNTVLVANKAPLPKIFINPILKLYQDKTILKGVKGKEEDYKLAKENLNSIYGMTATDPIHDEMELDMDEMVNITPDLEEQLSKVNTTRTRFLYYPWGVWITAYSRAALMNTIYDLIDEGVVVTYCDTDSIYAVDNELIEKVINRNNETITKNIRDRLEKHGYETEEIEDLMAPKDINGKRRQIGIFEPDVADPVTFKTLGAKRYVYVDKDTQLHLTVSGLSKNAADYISDMGGLSYFKDGMVVPEDESGRRVHTYNDGDLNHTLTDYLGNEYEVDQSGWIHLEKSEYNMTLSDKYVELINNFLIK